AGWPPRQPAGPHRERVLRGLHAVGAGRALRPAPRHCEDTDTHRDADAEARTRRVWQRSPVMTDRIFELAALDAVGALPPGERAQRSALLADAPDTIRREVAALYESAAALPAGSVLEQPSPSVRDRILAHAAARR